MTASAAAPPLAVGWQLLTFLVIALLGGLLARDRTGAVQRTVGDTLRRRARCIDAIDVPIGPQVRKAARRERNLACRFRRAAANLDGTMVQVLSVRGDRVLVRPLPVRPSRQSRFDFDIAPSSVDISHGLETGY
ncbi:MAG: hypothetical protein R3A10_02695 [Caldilineaceae bacterium]